MTTAAYEDVERRLFERYGLEIEQRFLELAEPRCRGRVLETGTGPPLLLVHGGGGMAAEWAPLMAELRGFRLIAIDRPGCGLSGLFDYTGVPLEPHGIAFLSSTLDALGLERAQIAGNSMGGLWALWLAAERPERVEALVLLGNPALLLETSAPLDFRLIGVRGLNRLLFKLMPPSEKQTRRLLERLLGKHAVARVPAEVVELHYRGQELPGADVAFRTLVERAVGFFGPRRGLPFTADRLRRVTQRTLFILGEHDVFGAPEYGRRAASVMPDARVEVVDGGHLPWFDEPARCAELISSFLAA